MIARLSMTLLLLTTIEYHDTHGYGDLVEPLSRSGIWKRNFQEAEFESVESNSSCGGPFVQYVENFGRCGECGDDYSLPRPRPHENGGTYGKGMIGRVYKEGGIVSAIVRLAGNHQGQFDFDVCPLSKNQSLETNECFSRYRLPLLDGSGYVFNVTNKTKQPRIIVVQLRLPYNLTCTHCVFRWQFRRKDSDFDESGFITYNDPIFGQSATWRSCADIAILKAKPMSLKNIGKDLFQIIRLMKNESKQDEKSPTD